MTRQHHLISRATAVAVALLAGAAPAALADPPPLAHAEAAIATQSSTVIRPNPDEQVLRAGHTTPSAPLYASVVRPNPDQQVSAVIPDSVLEAAAPATIVHVIAPSSGFDWGDAGIGVAVGLTIAGLGFVLFIRGTRRGTPRSGRPAIAQ